MKLECVQWKKFLQSQPASMLKVLLWSNQCWDYLPVEEMQMPDAETIYHQQRMIQQTLWLRCCQDFIHWMLEIKGGELGSSSSSSIWCGHMATEQLSTWPAFFLHVSVFIYAFVLRKVNLVMPIPPPGIINLAYYGLNTDYWWHGSQ